MTVQEMAETCAWKVLAGEDGLDREVEGCYAGDLLSWVMARAQSGDVWLTVMGNINAIAVASLTDCACILLTESAALDENAKARAEQQGMTLYLPPLSLCGDNGSMIACQAYYEYQAGHTAGLEQNCFATLSIEGE